jgi:L-cysteine S-thiosulfotransferase
MYPKTLLSAAGLGLIVLAGTGCAPDQKSTRGFVFPEGDIVRGKETFVELGCTECHHVSGIGDLPRYEIEANKVIVLGGEVRTTKTYGDLITAIIHPSESVTAIAGGRTDADPGMPDVNDTMTVQQMLDLVTFLSPQYVKLEPLYEEYYMP